MVELASIWRREDPGMKLLQICGGARHGRAEGPGSAVGVARRPVVRGGAGMADPVSTGCDGVRGARLGGVLLLLRWAVSADLR